MKRLPLDTSSICIHTSTLLLQDTIIWLRHQRTYVGGKGPVCLLTVFVLKTFLVPPFRRLPKEQGPPKTLSSHPETHRIFLALPDNRLNLTPVNPSVVPRTLSLYLSHFLRQINVIVVIREQQFGIVCGKRARSHPPW